MFEPIFGKNPKLSAVDVVAFDIFGMLIGRICCLKIEAAARKKKRYCLILAGYQLIAAGNGVQLKEEFYSAHVAQGSNVLAIDDQAHAATVATIHIDPNNERIKNISM